MLLIITPQTGWRRELEVVHIEGGSEADYFDAFQTANDRFAARGVRNLVNISLVPITLAQLDTWIRYNVVMNWWEYLWGRVRYNVNVYRKGLT